MASAPRNNRASSSALPWLPLPAILGFSLLGLGGSIVLTYSTFSYAEAAKPVTPSNDGKIYEARAVPFESRRESPALRDAISRALTAMQVEVRRDEEVDPEHREVSQPTLVVDSDRELT